MAGIALVFYMVVLIADTVRKEAATITAVFPSPNYVMSILVQVSYCSFVSSLSLFSRLLGSSYYVQMHTWYAKFVLVISQ